MKYIIFDIDGTLTDTTKVDDKCFMNSFESLFGINISDTNWNALKHVTDWGITEELFKLKLKREVAKEELASLKKLFVASLERELTIDKTQFAEIPGAPQFFERLQTIADFQIGIATGAWEESANLKLKAVGRNPYNTSYSNSSHYKSRELITKDVIRKIGKTSNSTPTEVVYFGDGVWDYHTCQKLGIRFIGIDTKGNGKLEKLGANEIYKDFTKADKILESIK